MPWCAPCDRYFSTERGFEQHLNNSSAHAVYEYDEYDESDEYECDTCCRVFLTERAADQHMDALGHRAAKYECDTCTAVFSVQLAADNHMNSKGHWHNYCHDCSRRFDNANNLQMHLNSRIHRGSSVTCPFCSKSFVGASGVSHHLETGSCPHAPTLNRKTLHRAIYDRDPHHLITTRQLEWHGEVEATDDSWNGSGYECYFCHKAFRSLRQLNVHANSAHQEPIYHCPNRSCPKEFVSLAALFNHLESESCRFIRFERVQKSVTSFLDGRRLIGF